MSSSARATTPKRFLGEKYRRRGREGVDGLGRRGVCGVFLV